MQSIQAVKEMENKAKYTAALVIALIAVGAFLILPPALAEEGQEDLQGPRWPGQRRFIRLRLLRGSLRNGVPTTVEGEAVVLEGHILVVKVGDNLVNVNLAGKWVVDDESMTVQELFNGAPFNFGDGLTISTLKLEMTAENHTVSGFLAYVIEDEKTRAHAILPFNIETQ